MPIITGSGKDVASGPWIRELGVHWQAWAGCRRGSKLPGTGWEQDTVNGAPLRQWSKKGHSGIVAAGWVEGGATDSDK